MSPRMRLTAADVERIRLWNRWLVVGILILLLWPGILVSPAPDWNKLRDPDSPALPAGSSPFVGTEQRLRVIISPDTTINAIKLVWKFDPTAFEVLGIDASLNPFYIVPPGGLFIDNTVGTLTLAGALPPPGWNSRAVIAYIDVKSKKRGVYDLQLQDFSKFYRKDKKATQDAAKVDPIIAEFR